MVNYFQKFRVFAIGVGISFGITLFAGVYNNSSVKPADASISMDKVQAQLNTMNHNNGWKKLL